MASLVGAALAGGVEGAGKGMAVTGQQWNAELQEQAKNDAIAARETNLARLNNQFAQERQTAAFTHDTEMETNVRQPFQKEQAASAFNNSLKLKDIEQKFTAEQNDMTRNLTREQIASNERIAQLNRGNAYAIANLGGTVQQDKNGNIFMIAKNGATKAILDPQTGQPMQGYKDLTPAAKAYTEVIKAQLVDLDKQETAAMSTGNEAAVAGITKRRAELTGTMLNVLTTGMDSAKLGAPKTAGAPPVAGTVMNGYSFKGGDPNNQSNWEPVKAGTTTAAPAANTATSAAPATSAASVQGDAIDVSGAALDQARNQLAQAQQTRRSFGLAGSKMNPTGVAQADAAIVAAQRALADAEKAYQTAAGGAGNASRKYASP